MNTLRRACPTLAALLIVFVTLQVLDWPGCADEVGHEPTSAQTSSGGAGSNGASGDEGTASGPDCLCHVVFVSVPVLAPAGTPALAGTPLAEGEETPASVSGDPSDPVPLA